MSDPGNVPDGYNEKSDLGRPKNSITKRNTQADNFGKDRLGTKRMKDKDNNGGDSINPKFKGGPLALENANTVYLQNKQIFEAMGNKKLVFQSDKDDTTLLDESQLKEQ